VKRLLFVINVAATLAVIVGFFLAGTGRPGPGFLFMLSALSIQVAFKFLTAEPVRKSSD